MELILYSSQMKDVLRFFCIFALSLCCLAFHRLPAQETPSQPEKGTTLQEETGPTFPAAFEEELKKAEEQGESKFYSEFMNMLFYLGIIVAFIFVFLWILKRLLSSQMQQANVTSSVKILERRALTQKTSIYVLQVFGRVLTVADSTNGVTLLSDVPYSEEHHKKELTR